MKKMLKRLCTGFLALATVVTALPTTPVHAESKQYVIIPKWPDLDQVISLHSRISNNLNQYARKANETGKLYEEDIAEIKQMHNEQTKFLKKILEAVMYLYEEDSKKKK